MDKHDVFSFFALYKNKFKLSTTIFNFITFPLPTTVVFLNYQGRLVSSRLMRGLGWAIIGLGMSTTLFGYIAQQPPVPRSFHSVGYFQSRGRGTICSGFGLPKS